MARGYKVYEWVFWFDDGHIMTQYTPEDSDLNKFERLIDEALEYHEKVSPVARVGWVPISQQKATYVNIKARYMECISKSPLPVHIVECHGQFPYVRRTTDIEYGFGSGKTQVKYGLYLIGIGGEKIEHPVDDKFTIEYQGGRYLMIDDSGNCRMDHTSFVLQPIPAVPMLPKEKLKN